MNMKLDNLIDALSHCLQLKSLSEISSSDKMKHLYDQAVISLETAHIKLTYKQDAFQDEVKQIIEKAKS